MSELKSATFCGILPAAALLLARADADVLDRVESPSVSPEIA